MQNNIKIDANNNYIKDINPISKADHCFGLGILAISIIKKFKLKTEEKAYIKEKGMDTIRKHATATCCRECLYKWHKIPKGRELTKMKLHI